MKQTGNLPSDSESDRRLVTVRQTGDLPSDSETDDATYRVTVRETGDLPIVGNRDRSRQAAR